MPERFSVESIHTSLTAASHVLLRSLSAEHSPHVYIRDSYFPRGILCATLWFTVRKFVVPGPYLFGLDNASCNALSLGVLNACILLLFLLGNLRTVTDFFGFSPSPARILLSTLG